MGSHAKYVLELVGIHGILIVSGILLAANLMAMPTSTLFVPLCCSHWQDEYSNIFKIYFALLLFSGLYHMDCWKIKQKKMSFYSFNVTWFRIEFTIFDNSLVENLSKLDHIYF